jgi:outer membrane protein
MNKKTRITLLLCCSFACSFGQEAAHKEPLLTLSDAIDAALDQNFDIRIAQVEQGQAKANNTIGNAGMLPSVTAIGGLNKSITDTRLELASGQVQDRKGATSEGITGAVQLDWVLFDGMRMFINRRRLQDWNKPAP